MLRFNFNALSKKFLSSEFKGQQMFRLASADRFVEHHKETIASIRQSVGISDALFDQLYLVSITRAAEILQSCPATAGGHHSWPGGLFGFSLQTSAYALRLRKGKIMPVGASPEKESKKNDLYTYAVFASALLNGLGQALDNQRLVLYDRRRNFLTEWRPLHEDWTDHPKARFMKIEFRQIPVNIRQPISSLMYVNRILDREGCSWLQGDQDVYNDFLNSFRDHPSGSIHQLVENAQIKAMGRDKDYGKGASATVSISTGSTEERPEEETSTVAEIIGRRAGPETGNVGAEPATREERKSHDETEIPGVGMISEEAVPRMDEDSDKAVPGEAFRKWVETGINDSTLAVNGKSTLAHIGRTNIFLVAPGIFERYAAENSMDWETEQRHFLSMEIHTRNGEKDWWFARVQTAGKMERIRGVLVSSEHFELKPGLPMNEQMAILRK